MTNSKIGEKAASAELPNDCLGNNPRILRFGEEECWRSLRRSGRVLSIPPLAVRRGRIVKTTGDGMLVRHPKSIQISIFADLLHAASATLRNAFTSDSSSFPSHITQKLCRPSWRGHYRSIGPRLNKSGEDIGDRQQSYQIGNLRRPSVRLDNQKPSRYSWWVPHCVKKSLG